jgi:hypothetical protein
MAILSRWHGIACRFTGFVEGCRTQCGNGMDVVLANRYRCDLV